MGRHTGWIALEIAEVVENRRRKGRKFNIVVVAEGVRYEEIGLLR